MIKLVIALSHALNIVSLQLFLSVLIPLLGSLPLKCLGLLLIVRVVNNYLSATP
jgi:hypothetical protein